LVAKGKRKRKDPLGEAILTGFGFPGAVVRKGEGERKNWICALLEFIVGTF